MFESAAIIVSLVSLGVAWRAYLISKRGFEVQAQAYALQKKELEAKQEARLQVSNETFLSSWQMDGGTDRCPPDEIALHYSAVLTNKGDSAATIESITIEVGPVSGLLDDPTAHIGHVVSGPMYLAAGESVSLQATLEANEIQITRMFFQHLEGVLVYSLSVKYRGYGGGMRMHRAEIYRINHMGGIVVKGNYDAAGGKPRSYLLSGASAGA